MKSILPLLLLSLFSLAVNSQVLDSSETVDSSATSTLNGVTLPSPKIVPPYQDTSPTVYLTFDDGPHPGTFIVGRIAQKKHIPISLFVVGLHYQESSPEKKNDFLLLRKNPLIEVVNHSQTHAYRNHYPKFYSDINGAVADIEQCQNGLRIKQKIVRLPGSNVWETPLCSQQTHFGQRSTISRILAQKGYCIMGWDGEWHFNYKTLYLNQPASEIVDIIDHKIRKHETMFRNHFVLLMHDRSFIHQKDQESLLELIRELKRRNYRFEFISRHPLIPQ